MSEYDALLETGQPAASEYDALLEETPNPTSEYDQLLDENFQHNPLNVVPDPRFENEPDPANPQTPVSVGTRLKNAILDPVVKIPKSVYDNFSAVVDVVDNSGMNSGVMRAGMHLAEGLTSPLGIATLGIMPGLSTLGKTVVGGVFSAPMIKAAPEQLLAAKNAETLGEATENVAMAAGGLAMSAGMVGHTPRGRMKVDTETGVVRSEDGVARISPEGDVVPMDETQAKSLKSLGKEVEPLGKEPPPIPTKAEREATVRTEELTELERVQKEQNEFLNKEYPEEPTVVTPTSKASIVGIGVAVKGNVVLKGRIGDTHADLKKSAKEQGLADDQLSEVLLSDEHIFTDSEGKDLNRVDAWVRAKETGRLNEEGLRKADKKNPDGSPKIPELDSQDLIVDLPNAARKLKLEEVDPETYERQEGVLPDENDVVYRDPKTNQILRLSKDDTAADLAYLLDAARGEEVEALKRSNQEAVAEGAQQERSKIAAEDMLTEQEANKPRVTDPAAQLWNSPKDLTRWLEREQGKPLPDAGSGRPSPQRDQAILLHKKIGDRIKELEKVQQKARVEMKKPAGKTGNKGSVNLDLLADAGRTFYRKGMEFVDWSKRVIASLGEKIKPHLQAIWKKINQGPIRTQKAAETGAVNAGGEKFSNRNAEIDAERKARGLEPTGQQIFSTGKGAHDEAMAKIQADPTLPTRLVVDLTENPRSVKPWENAALLQRRVELNNQSKAHIENAVKALEEGDFDAIESASAEDLRLSTERLQLEQVLKNTGTLAGQQLQARKNAMFEDFSYAVMETRKRLAKGGGTLTLEEVATLKTQATKISELETKLAEIEAKKDETQATAAADEAVKELVKKVEGTPAKVQRGRNLVSDHDATIKSMRKRLSDGETITDLGRSIQQIAEQFVRGGVKDRNQLIDSVQTALLEKLGIDMSKREVMDAISGYGEFKQLSQEEAKVTLRDLKGQMQQVAKIEDMLAGKAPSKTGMERRTPSDAERRLIKEVNELKKKGGFAVTDPATQLRSALDAIKTRLKNQLKDLANQIETGVKPKKKEGVAYDQEAEILKALRDEVKNTLEQIEGTPEISDAQRLKIVTDATQRNILEYERRISLGKRGVFEGRNPSKTPKNAALDALKAQRDALREEFKLLKELDQSLAEAKIQERLFDSITKLETRIKENDIAVKTRKAGPDSKETAELRAEQTRLKTQLADLRKAAKPKRTPEEIALQAYKTRTANEIARLKDKLARGDFEPKVRKPPVVKDAEAQKVEFQLSKTKEAYVEGLFNDQMERRSVPAKILGGATETANTARALVTSIDLSAVLRQGGFIAFGHPVRAAKSIMPMLRAFGSEQAQFKVEQEISNRPNAPLYQSSKLYLADRTTNILNKMEEAFMSRWARKIPVVAGSQRAYTTFLNKLRADSFDAMAASLSRNGTVTPMEAKAISNFINVATGRGTFGAGETAGPVLNTVFFSPRYVASRFQILAGQPLYKGNSRTRTLIAKEYARFGIGAGLVLTLGALAGGTIEDDPRSSDFGKIKLGNTRIDLFGGMVQATVLTSRIIKGETKSIGGKVVAIRGDKVPYRGDNTFDVMARFARTKFSPLFGSGVNLAVGENLMGKPATIKTELAAQVTPISLRDVYSVMKEQGVATGTALMVLGLLGFGIQQYSPRSPK